MIKISIDTSALVNKTIPELQRKIVRATAIALTKTAQQAQKGAISAMQQVFDRPTPYTLRGTRVKPAKYESLQASVEFKTDVSKGTQAEKYLGPEVFGGQRRHKRFEIALQRIGVLPSGMFIVPGQAMRLDAFGGIPARTIVQVLSYLQAFGEQGYSANMTSEKRAKLAKGTRRKYGYELVVIRPSRKPQRGGKQLAPGIWQRTSTGFGSSLRPLMMFVRAPTYRVRLPLQEIGNRAMASYFPGEFNKVFSS